MTSPAASPGYAEAPRGLTEGGLEDYADRLPLACVEAIQRETERAGGEAFSPNTVAAAAPGGRSVPPAALFIAGHSLGGTLAAIFASLHPEVVAGLILIEAPVNFGPGSGPYGLLARAAPGLTRPAGDVPGAALDLLAYTASPASIVWLRHLDQLVSLADPQALRTHALVERWSLDELAMPRRLFEDVAERLCRRNLFMTGGLEVSGRPADPVRIAAPVLLVVERWSDVAPPASAEPLLAAAPHPRSRLLLYPGDTGVALQHVGPLVGRHAHAELWPEILRWIGVRD